MWVLLGRKDTIANKYDSISSLSMHVSEHNKRKTECRNTVLKFNWYPNYCQINFCTHKVLSSIMYEGCSEMSQRISPYRAARNTSITITPSLNTDYFLSY